ncbi:MAG: hypothetical protein WCS35_06340, partial [Sphaerochaeta sp.]
IISCLRAAGFISTPWLLYGHITMNSDFCHGLFCLFTEKHNFILSFLSFLYLFAPIKYKACSVAKGYQEEKGLPQ